MSNTAEESAVGDEDVELGAAPAVLPGVADGSKATPLLVAADGELEVVLVGLTISRAEP